MKKGNFPFHSQQVHYEIECPDPVVEFIDTEEVSVGKGKKKSVKKSEVLKSMKSSDYIKKNPLSTERFSLQDMIDAGVPLKEVPTAIYEDEMTQQQLLDMVESVIDKKEGTYNKNEK